MCARVLQTGDVHEVPLSEELTFTRQYLAIEQVRFADRLRVRWEVDEDVAGMMVPHLVLQPLVENALRHGIAHREDGGEIEIGARRDGDRMHLWVRDNGPGYAPATGRRSGIGLANMRGRLAGLYGEAATLTFEAMAAEQGGGCRATIALPLRPSPIAPSVAPAPAAGVPASGRAARLRESASSLARFARSAIAWRVPLAFPILSEICASTMLGATASMMSPTKLAVVVRMAWRARGLRGSMADVSG